MVSVSDLVKQFNSSGTDVRKKFVFAGHGGWEGSYGYVTMPANTTFSFYVADGTSIGSDKSLDVDRGEFNGLGQLKRRDGSILAPVDVYKAGDQLKDYVLMPRTRLQAINQTKADRSGGSVGRSDGKPIIGARSMDMRFGNSGVDKRFITLAEGEYLWISQILATPEYLNADLHWSACRTTM